jgi:hypothetical protein
MTSLLALSGISKDMIYHHKTIVGLRTPPMPYSEVVFLLVYYQVIDETIHEQSCNYDPNF